MDAACAEAAAEARRRQLRAASAETQRQLRAARAAAVRARQRSDVEQWSARSRHIAMAIACVAADDGHHAAVWLATRGRKDMPVTRDLLEQLAA